MDDVFHRVFSTTKGRNLARALLGLCLSSFLMGCVDFKVPEFTVKVDLEMEALRRLKKVGESIEIRLMYNGTKRPFYDSSTGIPIVAAESYYISSSEQELKVPHHNVSAYWGNESRGLLLNVISARRVLENNVLSCGVFEIDDLKKLQGMTIPIKCKLIFVPEIPFD